MDRYEEFFRNEELDKKALQDRAARREARRKYVIAEKQNIYKKIKKIVKQVKRALVPSLLIGSLMVSIPMMVAVDYKYEMDLKLRDQLSSHSTETISEYLDYYGINSDGKVFELGSSPNIDKINLILNNTETGFYIYELSEKYGVDANILASIMFHEGILDENTSREVINERAKKFSEDINAVNKMLVDRYDFSSDVLENATLICGIQCENIGIDAMEQFIKNTRWVSYDGKFSYSIFTRDLFLMKCCPADYGVSKDISIDDNYLDTILSGVSNADVSVVVNGEVYKFYLLNDTDHLSSPYHYNNI